MEQGEHRFSIVLGQRMTWPELLARAQETEALGFDGLFLVDHFYGLKDLDDPTHEAYTMLAALAPFTYRLRLGVMVCGNTYRNPVFLLKQAISVDHVSGGRVDFGVGAGWVEREHEAYGWDFPSAKERVDRFAEALEIWNRLQRDERTTYEGKFYTLIDAPFQPKAVQPGGLPVLIGGSGPRMLRLTARHAAIWNAVGTPEEFADVNARLDEACALEGRDPATIVRSVSPSINLLASVEAFEEGVAAYHAAGVQHIYMPWPRVEAEVPVLREVARTILPRFRAAATVTTRRLVAATAEDIQATLAATGDGIERKLIAYLAGRPGERLDGAALQAACGIDKHVEVTRAFARMGELLAERGVARFWSEAQRGYLIESPVAELIRQA